MGGVGGVANSCPVFRVCVSCVGQWWESRIKSTGRSVRSVYFLADERDAKGALFTCVSGRGECHQEKQDGVGSKSNHVCVYLPPPVAKHCIGVCSACHREWKKPVKRANLPERYGSRIPQLCGVRHLQSRHDVFLGSVPPSTHAHAFSPPPTPSV
eukprot:TRINITY_DN10314_c0_g1_i1.p2 TRINITY_DN10314_c0_g1~~TRINITY_DN10314_c0_g1_i1.p2  ORF type:complete len:155 (+),score=0.31 TRINITY_DN10314_c0_g1_i1:338-802(+)